jgi:hypothetical protein
VTCSSACLHPQRGSNPCLHLESSARTHGGDLDHPWFWSGAASVTVVVRRRRVLAVGSGTALARRTQVSAPAGASCPKANSVSRILLGRRSGTAIPKAADSPGRPSPTSRLTTHHQPRPEHHDDAVDLSSDLSRQVRKRLSAGDLMVPCTGPGPSWPPRRRVLGDERRGAGEDRRRFRRIRAASDHVHRSGWIARTTVLVPVAEIREGEQGGLRGGPIGRQRRVLRCRVGGYWSAGLRAAVQTRRRRGLRAGSLARCGHRVGPQSFETSTRRFLAHAASLSPAATG